MLKFRNHLLGRRQARNMSVVLILLVLAVLTGTTPVLAGTWSGTGALTSARYYHTATLLKDGRVLVAGGFGPTDTLSSAELYAPGSETWSSAGFFIGKRFLHTATRLNDGRVLVVGGANGTGSSLASVQLFDPGLVTWSDAQSLATSRDQHTATLMPNGKVLVAGGQHNVAGSPSENLTSAEIYDPDTNTWASAGNLNQARLRHTATLMPDGKVLVAGGWGGSQLNSSELYDPGANSWGRYPPYDLQEPRERHTATLIDDGKVLAAGGEGWNFVAIARKTVELYNPVSKTWALINPMANTRYEHTANLLGNGKVLVVGGYNRTNYLKSAELYDPKLGTWSDEVAMVGTRSRHTATRLLNGKILVAGGMSGVTPLKTAELYTPDPKPSIAPGALLLLLQD